MYSFNFNEEDNKKKRGVGEGVPGTAADGVLADGGTPLLQPTDVTGNAQPASFGGYGNGSVLGRTHYASAFANDDASDGSFWLLVVTFMTEVLGNEG